VNAELAAYLRLGGPFSLGVQAGAAVPFVRPRFVYTGWPTRLLPVAWFDALMAFFGISHSMDEFRGR
jgi:hypothetical protein